MVAEVYEKFRNLDNSANGRVHLERLILKTSKLRSIAFPVLKFIRWSNFGFHYCRAMPSCGVCLCLSVTFVYCVKM